MRRVLSPQLNIQDVTFSELFWCVPFDGSLDATDAARQASRNEAQGAQREACVVLRPTVQC